MIPGVSWPLQGWRRRLAVILGALAAGGLAAVAHPPFGFLPGLLGYALLLGLVDRADGARPLRSAFWRGWLAGFAYFLIGCWWVAEAFLVDARQAWMAPFAASLLPAGLGLFWGAAAALYRKIAPGHVGRVAVFAASLALFEWLRGHVLTGFPWNLPGETWAAGGAVSQFASVVGAYGLTVLTLFAAAAFAPLASNEDRRRRIAMAAAGLAVIAGLWAWGAARLSAAKPSDTALMVRIVQPYVPQRDKWTQAAFDGIAHRYFALTAMPSETGRTPDLVIWPEGALPASTQQLLAEDAWTAEAMAEALKPGQTLLMGTYREHIAPGEGVDYFNSLLALRHGRDGRLAVVGTYDKHRLVPFGEFLPLEPLAEAIGLKELVHVGDGFSLGPRPRPMTLPGLPSFQPLICYESLFPELSNTGERPAFLVNISNDAWFGMTSGPRQHLNLASYRAIEQGAPILRATPTGVSAVIDPWGRTSRDRTLVAGERGVIDAPLPARLENTYFSRIGDGGFWVFTALGLLVAVPWGRLRRAALSK